MSAELRFSRPKHLLHAALFAGLALVLVALAGHPASAQDAKPAAKPAAEPVPKPDQSLKGLRSKVAAILRPGQASADELRMITDYFTKYAIPRWAVDADRVKVRGYRNELRNELRTAKEPARGQVIGLVLPILTNIAQGDYNPVARVNAMLMIGELNAVEVPPGRSGNPTPLPAALPLLTSAASSDTTPDAVRVAAILGIKRHADLGGVTASAQQTAAVAAMLKVVTSEPAAGRTADGHAWMRALAIDALAALKNPGPNGQAAVTLLGVLGEAAGPLPVRCAAARALGKLDYSGGAKIDLAAAIRQMGQLAVTATRQETEGDDEDKKDFSRRRVQARLIAIYNGLNGLAPVVTEQADVNLQKAVTATVRKCLETLESKRLEDEEVISQLNEQIKVLAGNLMAPATKPAAKPVATP